VSGGIDVFPSRPKLLLRGFARRCPWCSDRKAYFTGWFQRSDACHRCGHGYRRGDEAFELGAMTVNIMLTFALILGSFLVVVIATAPNIPVWWTFVGIGSMAVVAPAVLYPVSFTLWQAIDLSMRTPSADELDGASLSDGSA
jgi:uncharacterized protein (DUF983 family)